MCFPDKYFGPNLVFFIHLSNGRVLCIISQVEFWSKQCLPQGVQDKAVSMLMHSQFYKKKVSSFQGIASHICNPSWQHIDWFWHPQQYYPNCLQETQPNQRWWKMVPRWNSFFMCFGTLSSQTKWTTKPDRQFKHELLQGCDGQEKLHDKFDSTPLAKEQQDGRAFKWHEGEEVESLASHYFCLLFLACDDTHVQ